MKIEITQPSQKLAPGQVWRRRTGMFKGSVYLCVRHLDDLALIDTANFNSFWDRCMTPDSSMESFEYIGDVKFEHS